MEKFIELKNMQASIFALASRSNTKVLHSHKIGQLSVPKNGIIYFAVQGQLYISPPNIAVYIPANTPHCIYKTSPQTIIENIYFSKEYFNLLPQVTKTIVLSDLSKILIARLCKTSSNKLNTSKIQQMLNLLLEELHENTNKAEYKFKMPQNELLIKIFNYILTNDIENLPSLYDCAQIISVSSRTLQRIIKQELNISFVLWRGQILFMRALELLHKYKKTSIVTYQLGYNSESAFISMFKKFSGGKVPSYFY
ncbi:MAG: helix-turn-helix domain-containing protein [Burkholderiales bacterium]|nr:helix-turn-helix domain-containing protein [Burkholderiales bacterium]